MNKRDIKVGMRVRVKSWEKMLKGGFLKKEGYSEEVITFPSSTVLFTESMKDLCGQYATVKSIGERGVVLDWDITPIIGWTIIPQMLEPIEEKKKQAGVIFKEELFEPKTFTKEDLTLGMVVELRNGYICIVDGEGCVSRDQELILRHLKDLHNVTYLYNYKDNLLNNNYLGGCRGFDIMKVYEDYTMKNLLWERQEIQLSEREIEILKALKVLEFKYIARDSYKDSLFAYKANPEKGSSSWLGNDSNICRVTKDLFDFVKWEDEKPYSIEELLENESN